MPLPGGNLRGEMTVHAPPIPVFEARGLSRTYRAGEVEVRALRDVNLTLYQGEFVVILGPREREVDAPQHPGRPRRAYHRDGSLPRP